MRTRVRAGPLAAIVISLVAAFVATLIQAGDKFVPAWAPAFDQQTRVTLRLPYGPRVVRNAGNGRAELRYGRDVVQVPRGTVLQADNPTHRAAKMYEGLSRPPSWARLGGVFGIFFTLSLALAAYLRKFGQNRLKLLRTQIGIFVGIGAILLVSKALLLFTALPELWLPVAALPLWVATSFDRRTGFVLVVVLAFLVSSLMAFDLVLLVVLLARGMAATLLLFDRKHGRHMLLAGLLGGVASAALYAAIAVSVEGRFDFMADLSEGFSSLLLACVGGGVAAGAISTLLRSPASRLLGHVPRDRLLDLTDLEHPLLTKLAAEAPGTWEHSRAMANLAEQAASSIGADALLTRVGAYYHDVGKSLQRRYFVENLGPDEASPHEELEPDVSADAIMSHVVVGTKMCRERGVPESVVEFVYTHHGTQLVEYFWNKCLEAGNPKELDESAFRYPGMEPQTKETAILMLVDSIEAASRTIDPPHREEFQAMVQRVVFMKLASGQLDQSGLELSDLRVVSTRMVDTLVNMNHHRIKYPWQAKKAEQFGVPSQAVSRGSSPDIQVTAVEFVPASSVPLPPGEPLDQTQPSPGTVKRLTPLPGIRAVPDGETGTG